MEILKRLKPDAKKDDLDNLLACAATFGRVETVRYLLDLGAKPNDKPNGSSTALGKCLSSSLGFRSFGYGDSLYGSPSKASKYSVSDPLDTFRLLLEHGALWRPDDAREVGCVRRNLYECEPDVTLEVVERLVKHSAGLQETINKLIRTPAMKIHLEPVARRLALLGHTTLQMTSRYTHAMPENLRTAVDSLTGGPLSLRLVAGGSRSAPKSRQLATGTDGR